MTEYEAYDLAIKTVNKMNNPIIPTGKQLLSADNEYLYEQLEPIIEAYKILKENKVMKANELSCKDLMIGDYVYGCIETGIVGEATYRILCKVKEINDYGDIVVQCIEPLPDELDWQDGDDFSWIEPIPLTTEILEKIGFVLDDEWYIYTGQGVNIDVAFRDDNKFVYDLSILTGSGSMDIHAKYVHELQHALRLCGITHEIIL